ncbi:hypothetical protein VF13_40805, partial [Nostoc linckia z16]
PIIEVPNRYLAGITEVALKNHFSDKINWKRMLVNECCSDDLLEHRGKIRELLPEEVREYYDTTPEKLYAIEYPVLEYPKKINSLNLATTPNYSGTLAGIKGQYLLFKDGTVFNVRSYEGFNVAINV